MTRQSKNFVIAEDAALPTVSHQIRNVRLSVDIDRLRIQQDVTSRTDRLMRLMAASDWLPRDAHVSIPKDLLPDAFEAPPFIPCLVLVDHWKEPVAHDRLLVHLMESCHFEHPKIDTRIYQNNKLIHCVEVAGTAYAHPEKPEGDLFLATDITAPHGGIEADALTRLAGEPAHLALLCVSKIVRNNLLPTAMPLLQSAYLQTAHRAIYRHINAAYPTAKAFPQLHESQAKHLLRMVSALPGLTQDALPTPPPDLSREVILAQIAPLVRSLTVLTGHRNDD